MNALADRVAAGDVGSIFLYTNEAHPGEYYPHLTSMEQKFRLCQNWDHESYRKVSRAV